MFFIFIIGNDIDPNPYFSLWNDFKIMEIKSNYFRHIWPEMIFYTKRRK